MAKIAGREGSNAGRGFRYQDAVATWLAVCAWAKEHPPAIVVPEGGDDIELRGSTGSTLVQVKSRRPHLGPLQPSAARDYVQELWARNGAAAGYMLITEQGIAGLAPAPGHAPAPPSGKLNGLLSSDSLSAALLGRTRVVWAPSPLESAVRLIATARSSTPLAAQITFSQIYAVAGKLADENGRRRPIDCQGLSISDTDRIISDTLAAIDTDLLEIAIRNGSCEAVDFLTPLDDPQFYMGVDVQPGHLAASLVVHRPQALDAVSDGLQSKRAVLVAGPSGSGKSAIMWDAARSLSHSIRWYRLIRIDPGDLPALRRLATGMRASPNSPVGFVLDDVGRRGAEGWNAFARELTGIPGVLLLGSIREEDLFLLSERARVVEVRADPDEGVARALYDHLRSSGRTTWSGWREPWLIAHGLILEYAHILTAGERFGQTLKDQVAARVRDPARDAETAMLRVAAMAGAAGVAIDAGLLSARLDIADTAAARALARLVDEHLVRIDAEGQITGLHQLRSARLLILTHAPPRLEGTFVHAIACVRCRDLERLIAASLSEWRLDPSRVLASLTTRLRPDHDPEAIAAALRGLRAGQIAAGVDRWLECPEVAELARTQVGTAAMFGVSGVATPDVPQLANSAAAARVLMAIKTDPARNTRQLLLDALGEEVVAAAIGAARSPSTLDELLSAQVGHRLSPILRSSLQKLGPLVLNGDLVPIARLLGTIALLDPELAVDLARKSGTSATIGRIGGEVPWATEASFRPGADGLEVHCEYRLISEADQPDVHEEVVKLCELSLALAPEADLAAVRAVSSDGNVLGFKGFALADKRIRRENLPPAALPEWNRRWLDAVGQRVATANYTEYLSRAASITERLLPTLERVLEAIVRNKNVSGQLVEALNALNDEATTLTPPRTLPASTSGFGSEDSRNSVTPLQDTIFNATVNLPKRFLELPAGSDAMVMWCRDRIEQLRRAREEEPWYLLEDGPPASLGQLEDILHRVRALAGEARAHNERPSATFRHVAKNARSGNALRAAAAAATTSAGHRRNRSLADVRSQLTVTGIAATVHAADDPDADVPWPPTQYLVVTEATSIEAAFYLTGKAAAATRSAVGDFVRITVAPVVAGRIVVPLTMTGVSTLFPVPVGWIPWRQPGVPEAHEFPPLNAFDGAARAAMSLAAMDVHRLGLPGRPEIEVSTRAVLEGRFASFRGELEEDIPPELRSDVESLVLRMRSGQFQLPSNLPEKADDIKPQHCEFLAARFAIMEAALNRV